MESTFLLFFGLCYRRNLRKFVIFWFWWSKTHYNRGHKAQKSAFFYRRSLRKIDVFLVGGGGGPLRKNPEVFKIFYEPLTPDFAGEMTIFSP